MGPGLKARLDYGDYCAIPTDGKRYELLGGDILVDPATERIECYRRDGRRYREVCSASVEATLTHPDFPGLGLPLVQLWRSASQTGS